MIQCFAVAPPGFSSRSGAAPPVCVLNVLTCVNIHEAAKFKMDQSIVVCWPVGRVDIIQSEDQQGAGFKGCPAATSLYHYLISRSLSQRDIVPNKKQLSLSQCECVCVCAHCA